MNSGAKTNASGKIVPRDSEARKRTIVIVSVVLLFLNFLENSFLNFCLCFIMMKTL